MITKVKDNFFLIENKEDYQTLLKEYEQTRQKHAYDSSEYSLPSHYPCIAEFTSYSEADQQACMFEFIYREDVTLLAKYLLPQ